ARRRRSSMGTLPLEGVAGLRRLYAAAKPEGDTPRYGTVMPSSRKCRGARLDTFTLRGWAEPQPPDQRRRQHDAEPGPVQSRLDGGGHRPRRPAALGDLLQPVAVDDIGDAVGQQQREEEGDAVRDAREQQGARAQDEAV